MSMGEASAAVRSYQMALQLDPASAAGQREVSQLSYVGSDIYLSLSYFLLGKMKT